MSRGDVLVIACLYRIDILIRRAKSAIGFGSPSNSLRRKPQTHRTWSAAFSFVRLF